MKSASNQSNKKIEPSFLQKSIYQREYLWYSLGVIVRIISTVIYPQQGYIHPDEFFQGPEIVFDDLFQLNLTRTHEFHPSAPLRSVAILYLLYGLPVSILSYCSSLFHWSAIPFDLKLILPRMTILFLSLCTDILFHRLMKHFYPKLNSKEYGTMMNYYGIAHVTLVFFTRTLSNSFEAFLFLTLIYLVIKNLSSILNNKDSLLTPINLLFTSSLIGVICALGLFNRPTFPAFAFIPILYWCITIISTFGHLSRSYFFISRILSFILVGFLLPSSLFILFDSYYYNHGFSFIIDLKTRLIICPLNFILYNIDSTNLDKHGLHSLWLHFTVNAMILYGPLHLATVCWGLMKLFRIDKQSSSLFLICLYFIPYIPLSTFPHQEPRFLLPLIYPLILLIIPRLIKQNLHQSIFNFWLIFNILVAIIYGYIHQGGLLRALRHVHNSPMETNKKLVITYHTYMPPGYLLCSTSKSEATMIIDLQGAKREKLDSTIERIFNEYSVNQIEVYLILPVTCQMNFMHFKEEKYSFELLEQFQPHLDLDHNLIESLSGSIFNQFELDLYRMRFFAPEMNSSSALLT